MLAEGDDRLDAAARGGEGIFHGPRTALLGQASRKAGVIQVDPDDGLPLLLENGGGADAGSGTDDDVHTGPGGRLTTEVITRIGAPGPRPSDPGVSPGGSLGRCDDLMEKQPVCRRQSPPDILVHVPRGRNPWGGRVSPKDDYPAGRHQLRHAIRKSVQERLRTCHPHARKTRHQLINRSCYIAYATRCGRDTNQGICTQTINSLGIEALIIIQ